MTRQRLKVLAFAVPMGLVGIAGAFGSVSIALGAAQLRDRVMWALFMAVVGAFIAAAVVVLSIVALVQRRVDDSWGWLVAAGIAAVVVIGLDGLAVAGVLAEITPFMGVD